VHPRCGALRANELGGLLNLECGPWWATLGPPFSCYQLSQNVVDNPS
jgi:hypothetical protein